MTTRASVFALLWIVGCFLADAGNAQTWKSRPAPAVGERTLEERVAKLEEKVASVEDNVGILRIVWEIGSLSFLFGIVAALWAQNTGRNPKLWFLLGAAGQIFTMILVLLKNDMDSKAHPEKARRGGGLLGKTPKGSDGEQSRV